MVETAPVAVAQLLNRATGDLTGRVADPRRTAVALLAHFLGGHLEVVTVDSIADNDVVEAYRAAVRRAAEGEPPQYVIGEAGFRTLRLSVDRHVLIPRPETEGLVQLALDWAGTRADPAGLRALDLGTGSGCIALSLAAEGDFARIVATDVSRAALDVARRNAELNGVTGVEFLHGPFFDPVGGEKFDLVLANPPYVSTDEYELLEASVRHHEPSLALVSASGGLEHTETILALARDRVTAGGLLAIEIDSRRADRSLQLAVRNGWPAAEIGLDAFGRRRFLIAPAGSHR